MADGDLGVVVVVVLGEGDRGLKEAVAEVVEDHDAADEVGGFIGGSEFGVEGAEVVESSEQQEGCGGKYGAVAEDEGGGRAVGHGQEEEDVALGGYRLPIC